MKKNLGQLHLHLHKNSMSARTVSLLSNALENYTHKYYTQEILYFKYNVQMNVS